MHDAINAFRRNWYRGSEIMPRLNWILFPQEQPRFAVGERKSPSITSALHLPAEISNLAVRDKEGTIFRADLALNRELKERLVSCFWTKRGNIDFRFGKDYAVIAG